jgi:hypothetical protein
VTRDRRTWDDAMREAVHLSAMGYEAEGIALMRAWHEERRRRRVQRQAEEGPDILAPERLEETGGGCHSGHSSGQTRGDSGDGT